MKHTLSAKANALRFLVGFIYEHRTLAPVEVSILVRAVACAHLKLLWTLLATRSQRLWNTSWEKIIGNKRTGYRVYSNMVGQLPTRLKTHFWWISNQLWMDCSPLYIFCQSRSHLSLHCVTYLWTLGNLVICHTLIPEEPRVLRKAGKKKLNMFLKYDINTVSVLTLRAFLTYGYECDRGRGWRPWWHCAFRLASQEYTGTAPLGPGFTIMLHYCHLDILTTFCTRVSEFSILHLAYKLWSQSWVYLLLGERRREGFFLLYMPTVAQFYFSVRYKYSLERQMSPCLPTTLSWAQQPSHEVKCLACGRITSFPFALRGSRNHPLYYSQQSQHSRFC